MRELSLLNSFFVYKNKMRPFDMSKGDISNLTVSPSFSPADISRSRLRQCAMT